MLVAEDKPVSADSDPPGDDVIDSLAGGQRSDDPHRFPLEKILLKKPDRTDLDLKESFGSLLTQCEHNEGGGLLVSWFHPDLNDGPVDLNFLLGIIKMRGCLAGREKTGG